VNLIKLLRSIDGEAEAVRQVCGRFVPPEADGLRVAKLRL
jgi:hypothetical protein